MMLEVRGLEKSFGETRALAGLDLRVEGGAIVGIAGTNGAGKSTLVRVLAGEDKPDRGSIALDGAVAGDGERTWVAVVHQEPQLFGNLTVAENVVIGEEGVRWRRPGAPGDDVRRVLAEFELADVGHCLLGELPLATRQRVEIARAVRRNARVYLFDEPNSALTEEESTQLFVWMHKLADNGAVVLLVTHRLGELVEHAASVLVVRDGVISDHLEGAFTQDDISAAMLTGDQAQQPASSTARSGGAAGATLRLDDWRSRAGAFDVPRWEAPSGEVVAVVGVEGSGGREFVASLGGRHPVIATAGLEAGGEMSAAYLPADRKVSLFHQFSIAGNVAARLGRPVTAGPAGLLRFGRIRRLGNTTRSDYAVASASADQLVSSLSGGNQQKVAVAATLVSRPTLVGIEEPTRGVDVGSRLEIHRVLRAYAREGACVVVFCTETSEVYQLADRVVVMDRGRLSAPVRVADHATPTSLARALVSLETHASTRLRATGAHHSGEVTP